MLERLGDYNIHRWLTFIFIQSIKNHGLTEPTNLPERS